MCGMYGSFVLSVIVNDKYVPSPSLINYQLIKSDQERERERERKRDHVKLNVLFAFKCIKSASTLYAARTMQCNTCWCV